MNQRRLYLAFFIAPAAAALAWAIGLLLMGLLANDSSPLGTFVFILYWVAAVAYAHALILGLPIALLMVRLHRLTLAGVLVTSALIGALPYIVYAVYTEVGDTSSSSSFNGVDHVVDGVLTFQGWVGHAITALEFGGTGLLAGVVWWFVGGAKRVRVV